MGKRRDSNRGPHTQKFCIRPVHSRTWVQIRIPLHRWLLGGLVGTPQRAADLGLFGEVVMRLEEEPSGHTHKTSVNNKLIISEGR